MEAKIGAAEFIISAIGAFFVLIGAIGHDVCHLVLSCGNEFERGECGFGLFVEGGEGGELLAE